MEYTTRNRTYKYDRETFDIGPGEQGEKRYVVRKDFSITFPDGHVITVKKGFKFDGASIPRILMFIAGLLALTWAILNPGMLIISVLILLLFALLAYTPFNPMYIIAAAVHDYNYRHHNVPRPEADLGFMDILVIEKTNIVRAIVFYVAVRAGGLRGWHKKL